MTKTTKEMEPWLLSGNDLATLLGVSLRHIRRMNNIGALPSPVRIGCAVRWRADEIKGWLVAGTPPRDEWEPKAVSKIKHMDMYTPLIDMPFNIRARNAFREIGIDSLGSLVKTSSMDLMCAKNCGVSTIRGIRRVLYIYDLTLADG